MSEGLLLISKVLETKSRLLLSDLNPSLFNGDEEQDVYQYLRRHLRRYNKIPTLKTIHKETGVELPSADDTYDYYLNRLRDRAIFNDIRDLFPGFREAMRNQEMGEVADIARRMSRMDAKYRARNDLLLPKDANQLMMRRINDLRMSGEEVGIPTGFPMLTSKMYGWQRGDLNFIVARPNVGKTMIALIAAIEAVLATAKVLVISMEMPLDQLMQRVHFLRTGINTNFIRTGRLSTQALQMLTQSVEEVDAWDNLHLFAGHFASNTDAVEDLIGQLSPDLVIIDAYYLLEASNQHGRDRFQSIAYTTDELKKLTITHNIPILCTSQFNRDAGKGGRFGSLENMGFTDAIAQHSSYAYALRYGRHRNERELVTLKAREGGWGSMFMNFSFSPRNFEPIEWVMPKEKKKRRTEQEREESRNRTQRRMA